MSPVRFFEPNILLCSISRNPVETAKKLRACDLLEDDNAAISVQVLQEFYVQATRPQDLTKGFVPADKPGFARRRSQSESPVCAPSPR